MTEALRRGGRRGAAVDRRLLRRRRPAAHAGRQAVPRLLAVRARVVDAPTRRDVRRAPRRMPPLPSRLRPRPGAVARRRSGIARDVRGAGRASRARTAARGALDALPRRAGRRLREPQRRARAAARACSRPTCAGAACRRASARSARATRGGRGRAGMGAAAVLARLLRAPAARTTRATSRHELQERYRGALEWARRRASALAAWQEGRTGFPLVDAGMRQLRATGWMHNRVRLVVGSFLTKDLHLDWRAGEAWFARLLLDGEPAQNNGNWQWIASVGADPAPVFRRMYNPALPPGALRPRRRVRAPLGARAARRARRAPRRAVDDERRRAAGGRLRDRPRLSGSRSSTTRPSGGGARALPGGGERRAGTFVAGRVDANRGAAAAHGVASQGSPRPARAARSGGPLTRARRPRRRRRPATPPSVTCTSELASETLGTACGRSRSRAARTPRRRRRPRAPRATSAIRNGSAWSVPPRNVATPVMMPRWNGAAATRERAVVGQRLGHAHADRRAERGGEARRAARRATRPRRRTRRSARASRSCRR